MQCDADVSQVSMCGEDQAFGQDKLKYVNEYLKGKIGLDINAKKWLEGCSGLNKFEKSEVIMRIVYEICLAKNIEYDLENEAAGNVKENNKDILFNTRRIFEILQKVHHLLLPKDLRRIVELICQSGNVKLLEMICQKENKDGDGKAQISQQYLWKGEFTGYETVTDLLQYVLKQQCSSEIVLCIAKNVFGRVHILCNGEQYLDDIQVTRMKGSFDYPDSVIKNCLKAAIELGYKDVVSVMLSGDVYHCIRLIKYKRFQEEERFSEALDMIEETVAEVMSSWVKGQSCKNEVLSLLKEGIEIDFNKIRRQALADELESRGIEFSRYGKKKENLVERLMQEGGNVRVSKTVVGALISTLFFNYQDELMNDKKRFELETSTRDENERKEEIKELNDKIDSKSFVKEKVLEKIKSLNSNSHMRNDWFFRELLAAIVTDEERFSKLCKLQAVCAAICKKPMQKFLKGVEVGEDAMIVLKFFGLEPNRIKTSIPKKGHSRVSVGTLFAEDIENIAKGLKEMEDQTLIGNEISEITKRLVNSKVPAFSGLSRRTIITLKNKRDKTDDKAKDFEDARGISQINQQYCSSTSCDPPEINMTLNQVSKGSLLEELVIHLEKVEQQSLSPLSAASKRRHSTSNLSNEKVAEKSDKSFLRNDCGQNGNGIYNKDENSHRHDRETTSISRRMGVPKINFRELEEKEKKINAELLTNKLLGRVDREGFTCPPKIEDLVKANRTMYKKKTLDEFVLNYSRLSYHDLYRGDSPKRDLSGSLDIGSCKNEDLQEFLELFRSKVYFSKYENAISKLVSDDVSVAIKMLFDLVNDAVQPAYYAYALVLLKELLKQCDLRSGAKGNVHVIQEGVDDIEEAIQLLGMAKKMQPASSFLLGLIKRYNVGGCSQFMGESWKDDLVLVVDTALSLGFYNISESALKDIDHDHAWTSGRCGLGMQKKLDNLKEMAKYSLYEIAIGMSKEQLCNNTLDELFTILSKDGFPNASYSYAVMLLGKKMSEASQENVKKAIGCLDDAVSVGCKGAELLLGTLLFKNSTSHIFSASQKEHYITKLEDYISKSDDSYLMNKKNVDIMTLCLAEQYYIQKSRLVEHDKEKAEKMLLSRRLSEELLVGCLSIYNC